MGTSLYAVVFVQFSMVVDAFASFGCCGVTDPLGDLVTLGFLETGLLDRPADKETS